ncbi:hypothetical protein L3Q82_020166, partial [Scortum barcoo]
AVVAMTAGSVSAPLIIPIIHLQTHRAKNHIDTSTPVSIQSDTPGALIFYTLDSSKPGVVQRGPAGSSRKYSEPILLPAGRVAVRAAAVTSDGRQSSTVTKVFLVELVDSNNRKESDENFLHSDQQRPSEGTSWSVRNSAAPLLRPPGAPSSLNKEPSMMGNGFPHSGTRFLNSRLGSPSTAAQAGSSQRSQSVNPGMLKQLSSTQTTQIHRETNFLRCSQCLSLRPSDPLALFCAWCGAAVPPLPEQRLPPAERGQMVCCVFCNSLLPVNTHTCLICEASVHQQLQPQSSLTLQGCCFGVGVVVVVGGVQSGIMPVVSSQEELEKLTRRHAVKVLPQAGCSVEEVGSAVGEVVGFESVKSASRMNSAVVIFLDEVVKVERYNRNVTKQITRSLQDLETEVQHLLSCTGDQGHVETLKSKKAAIANLLGITAQGALVRSRFMNASMLDSPSKFFFSLESRNGQRKVIHCLRSDNGSSLTETTEIRRYATGFYRDLFKTELVEDPELDSTFLSGLPQVGDSSDSLLSADLTLDELHVALMSLANGKAPGIDGIPVEFYKGFLLAGGGLAVVDPPSNLLSRVQAILVDFFWDRLHWLPQAVLFLPKEEGGQGLVHLASRCAAFRLQFIPEAAVRTTGSGVETSGSADPASSMWKLLWRQRVQERRMLGEYSRGLTAPCSGDPFPSLIICPSSNQQGEVNLKEAKGKVLSVLMVRCLNRQKLQHRSLLPWRAHLSLGEEVRPEWRSLYKPPLSKRVADLQWRLLHGILAVNAFISVLNPAVPNTCPFCEAVETVFHCFTECHRLIPLFYHVGLVCSGRQERFFLSEPSFLVLRYNKTQKDKCQMMNFILGQSKVYGGDHLVCVCCGSGNPPHVSRCLTCESRLQPVCVGDSAPSVPSADSRMSRCSRCKRMNHSDARYCDWCGSKPGHAVSCVICWQCGASGHPYALHCAACGVFLEAPAPPTSCSDTTRPEGGVATTQSFEQASALTSHDATWQATPSSGTSTVKLATPTAERSSQTVGLYFPSATELHRKEQQRALQLSRQQVTRDCLPLLTAISPGRGYWRKQVDHVCAHLRSYAQNNAPFRALLGEPRLGRMVSAVIQEDRYEVSVTISFMSAGRGEKQVSVCVFTDDPAGGSVGAAGRTETLSSVTERSADSSLRSDRSTAAMTPKPLRIPKPPVKDVQLLKELGPGRGQVAVIQQLLDQGADPSCCGSDGRHALAVAVVNGHHDVLPVLLQRGADVDQQSGQMKNSALHEAAALGSEGLQSARVLLSCKASVRRRNSGGQTAYDVAVKSDCDNMVSLLAAQTGLDLLSRLGKPKETKTS